jgi:hypothetical protein
MLNITVIIILYLNNPTNLSLSVHTRIMKKCYYEFLTDGIIMLIHKTFVPSTVVTHVEVNDRLPSVYCCTVTFLVQAVRGYMYNWPSCTKYSNIIFLGKHVERKHVEGHGETHCAVDSLFNGPASKELLV